MFHQIRRNYAKGIVVVVLFMVAWLVMGWVFGWIWQAIDPGSWLTPESAEVIAALVGEALILGTYFWGGGAALALAGAKKAPPEQYPQLHALADSLSYGAGVPKPELYVIDDPSPNAFATGRDARNGSLAVTTGLLEKLDREELEGVLAHEMTHIRNHDVMLLLMVAMMVGAAALVASLCWQVVRSSRSLRVDLVAGLIGLVTALFGFVVGPLMQFALSRSRESLADAGAAELTRNPQGILKALEKIAANDQPLKDFTHTTAAMFIDNPLEHHDAWWHRLFDTHPPMSERIRALQSIAEVRET